MDRLCNSGIRGSRCTIANCDIVLPIQLIVVHLRFPSRTKSDISCFFCVTRLTYMRNHGIAFRYKRIQSLNVFYVRVLCTCFMFFFYRRFQSICLRHIISDKYVKYTQRLLSALITFCQKDKFSFFFFSFRNSVIRCEISLYKSAGISATRLPRKATWDISNSVSRSYSISVSRSRTILEESVPKTRTRASRLNTYADNGDSRRRREASQALHHVVLRRYN